MSQIWLLRRVGTKTDDFPFVLQDGLNTIGRSLNNALCLHSLWVSKFHCQVTVSQGVLYIEDLGSSNGTFVNSIKLDVKRRTELKIGDLISLGKLYSKDEEPLSAEHYVYKVTLCGIARTTSETERSGITKRRSSSSPNQEAPKRLRSTPPLQVPTQVRSNCEVVDLTDDDDPPHNLMNGNILNENSSAAPAKSDPRVIAQFDLTDCKNDLKPNEIQDFPLAHSTLLNGSSSNEREEAKLITLLENIAPEILKKTFEKVLLKRNIDSVEINSADGSHINESTLNENNDGVFKRPPLPEGIPLTNHKTKLLPSCGSSSLQNGNTCNIQSLTDISRSSSSSEEVIILESNEVSDETNKPNEISSLKVNSVISLTSANGNFENEISWVHELIPLSKELSITPVHSSATSKRRRRYGGGEDDLHIKSFNSQSGIISSSNTGNSVSSIKLTSPLKSSIDSSDNPAINGISKSELLERKKSPISKEESLPIDFCWKFSDKSIPDKQNTTAVSDSIQKPPCKPRSPQRHKTIDESDCIQKLSSKPCPLAVERRKTIDESDGIQKSSCKPCSLTAQRRKTIDESDSIRKSFSKPCSPAAQRRKTIDESDSIRKSSSKPCSPAAAAERRKTIDESVSIRKSSSKPCSPGIQRRKSADSGSQSIGAPYEDSIRPDPGSSSLVTKVLCSGSSDSIRKSSSKSRSPAAQRRKTIDESDSIQKSSTKPCSPGTPRRKSTESGSQRIGAPHEDSCLPDPGSSSFVKNVSCSGSSGSCTAPSRKIDNDKLNINKLLMDLESPNSESLSQVIHSSKATKYSKNPDKSNSEIEASYSIKDIEEQLQKGINMNPSTFNDNLEVDHDVNDALSNNSFSQEGDIEVDDDTYTSFFEVIDLDNNEDHTWVPLPQPQIIGSIIKEEVDEIIEEDALNDQLFMSHFSQCSQEDENFAPSNGGDLRINEASDLRTRDDEKDFHGFQEDAAEAVYFADNKEKAIVRTKDLVGLTCEEVSKIPSYDLRPPSAGPSHQRALPLEPKSQPLTILPKGLSGSKLVKSTLLSQPLVKSRKSKKSQSKPEPSATRDAILKRDLQKLNEERKAKLKKIALTKNLGKTDEASSSTVCNKENQNEPRETVITLNKIAKVTERNRGTILLEGLTENPETRRTRSKSKTAPNVPCGVSKDDSKLKSCLKKSLNSNCEKNVRFSEKIDISYFECEGTLNRKIDVSSSKDNKLLPSVQRHSLAFPHLLDKFIFNVVHWNTSWIQESKVVKGDPKLTADEIYRGKEIFVSFDDYQRWLLPMIYHELWANLVRSIDEKDSHKSTKVFNGVILHEEPRRNSPNGRLLILKCCVPIKGKEIPSLVDPQDNIIISPINQPDMRIPHNSKDKRVMLFGFVDSQVRVTNARYTSDPIALDYLNKTCKEAPEVCAYFDVAVQNKPQMIIKKGCPVRIRFTYNMRNEMTQYESLIKLKLSPLLSAIIDPEKNLSVELPKNLKDMKPISTFPLNEDQKRAILGTSHIALAGKPSISLIHGPPGTGKTRVIIGIVEQLVHHLKPKSTRERGIIMICTQCNSAIDEICLRMLDVRKQLPREKRFKLTRFGRKERVHSKVHDILTSSLAQKSVEKVNLDEALTLDMDLYKARERSIATMIENVTKENKPNKEIQLRQYKQMYATIQEYIRRVDPFVNKKNVSEELRKKEIGRLVAEEELKVIFRSDIIATTLGSCTSRKIINALNEQREGFKRSIDICIIDEASQATEADTLLPLIHGVKNIILVGDHQQLPPFVASKTSKENGLSVSLFERLHKVWSKLGLTKEVPIFPLRVQHRMHPEIASFPSATFYENQLVTPKFLDINRGYRPYALFTHSYKQESPVSETNLEEAKLILSILDEIVDNVLFKSLSIGIIVPYQQQRSILFNLIYERKYLRVVVVNTIDSYQGQEKDVIIVSTVRTNGVGFLSDYQRMNVAITRAKKALYIFGNFSSLQGEPTWKNLLLDAKKRKAHLDVSKKTPSEVLEFITASKKRKRSTKS